MLFILGLVIAWIAIVVVQQSEKPSSLPPKPF